MLKNKFLRLLFDPRGTISRREYWACLLFLLFLLFSSNLWYTWHEILSKFGANSMSISDYDGRVIPYIKYVFSSLTAILYFTSIATAISVFVVTIKRASALGFSRVKGWLMAIGTYLLYFSINGIYTAMSYYNETDSLYRDRGGDTSVITYINIGLGLFMLIGLIIIIMLSRQTGEDYSEEIDYNAYDSIKSLFGLAKFYLIYIAVLVLWIWLAPYIGKPSVYLMSLFSLGMLCFYISIFIRRSNDAGVSWGYFVGAIVVLLVSIASFIYLKVNDDYLEDHPMVQILFERFCYLLLNLYSIYTFVLIVLPTRRRLMMDDDDLEGVKTETSE